MNWLKLFKLAKCDKCQKIFRKHKNTSVGGGFNGEVWTTFYYCNECTNKFLRDVFSKRKRIK
jgi:hypothetical protein